MTNDDPSRGYVWRLPVSEELIDQRKEDMVKYGLISSAVERAEESSYYNNLRGKSDGESTSDHDEPLIDDDSDNFHSALPGGEDAESDDFSSHEDENDPTYTEDQDMARERRELREELLKRKAKEPSSAPTGGAVWGSF